MTLTELRDNEALRRDLGIRYPFGWRVGLDEDGRWAILYRMPPEKAREAARKEDE